MKGYRPYSRRRGLVIQKIFQDRFSKQRKGTTNLKKDPSATKEKEFFASVSQHQS
jgi:hypothetical protein